MIKFHLAKHYLLNYKIIQNEPTFKSTRTTSTIILIYASVGIRTIEPMWRTPKKTKALRWVLMVSTVKLESTKLTKMKMTLTSA